MSACGSFHGRVKPAARHSATTAASSAFANGRITSVMRHGKTSRSPGAFCLSDFRGRGRLRADQGSRGSHEALRAALLAAEDWKRSADKAFEVWPGNLPEAYVENPP